MPGFKQTWRYVGFAVTMNDGGPGRKYLVVTGSSAGGIESLSRLLEHLRSDFPAPIVVAQHLDPNVRSNLAEILAKRTQMNVRSVQDHDALEPGTVYVVPSDRHVKIEDGHISLLSGPERPKPSVDLLFTSAARSYGERLVAMVLTGMGSDGSAGVRAVKEHGGTVIIEDPATAAFPSMPGSLPLSLVDVVAPIERISAELEDLFDEQPVLTHDSASLAMLLERLRKRSGIDFTHYKEPTIRRRLSRQMKARGLTSFTDYVELLEREPSEYERLAAAFLIKVTQFFRDPEIFEWLKESAVPAIVADARNNSKELRLWSAGCSTGEEAYSLAIVIAEALGDELKDFNVRIFATDIDESAIAFARHGIYPASVVASLPPEIVERYFTRTDGMYVIRADVREMTIFGQHDLGQRAPFPRIDLVMCRNVLIYFSKELQQRTLGLFAYSLRQGGYLVLGKAETSSPLQGSFEVIEPRLKLFRRTGEPVAIPAASLQKLPQRPTLKTLKSNILDEGREARLTAHEAVGSFVMGSTIGFVVTDDRYDITIINGAARQMLSIHGTAVGEDLIHLLPGGAVAHVRPILDAAIRNEEIEPVEIEIPGDAARFLSASAYPSQMGTRTEAALLVVDITTLVKLRRDAESKANDRAVELASLREHYERARETEQRLRESNAELVASNVELRARSDALLIGAEETTAATEEVETLNEELQATNEELETLNEEFQATIEELNTSNDELEARTVELQELVVGNESVRRAAVVSRDALQALVDAFPEPICAVDADGAVIASNRAWVQLSGASHERTIEIEQNSGERLAAGILLQRAAGGKAFGFTYIATDAKQSRIAFRGTASPLNDGEAVAFVKMERVQ